MSEFLDAVLGRLRVTGGPNDRGDYTAWCPFHDDGNGVPPHQANLRVGPTTFICHACGVKGGLRKLAQHLGIDLPSLGDKDVTYDYRDEEGNLLYQVVRSPGKRFWQRRPDGNGGWLKSLKGVRRVPYRLPELLGRPDDPVYLVEGEKDADRLAELGLLATTTAGGAHAWKAKYVPFFVRRDVRMLPDNDAPGLEYMETAAKSLHGKASAIRVVHLPGLAQKGDVSNWLDQGGDAAQLVALSESTALWQSPTKVADAAGDPGTADDTDDTDGSSGTTLARQLVDLVLQQDVDLFHDEREEPHARIPTPEGGRIIVATSSRSFRRFLALTAFRRMDKALGGETLAAACRTIDAIACFERPQYALHVRVAWHEEAIWIDIDGRRAIRVQPGGWTIQSEPPILFRSYPHQLPLAVPVPGGNPERIFDFLNLPHDERRVLYLGYLVTGFVPDIPVPALIVHGPQGTAKTSLLRASKRLLDPSRVEVRGGVKDQTEYAQAAAQNRMIVFDNLSSIPDWLSDALCRTVTGDGFAKRTLYTDDDTTILEIRSLVGITGINNVATRADLLERSVLLELQPLDPRKRREERELWMAFDVARGEILGGILDALAKAMELHPTLQVESIPRMADAAKWGCAAIEALGLSAGAYLEAYSVNASRQTSAALDESLVAQAVLRFMGERSEWVGRASKLLADLAPAAEAEHIDVKSRFWPKAANRLSRQLNEARPILEARGIRFERGRGDERTIRLERVPASTDGTVGPSEDRSGAARGSPDPDGPDDGRDRREPIVVPQGSVLRGPWGRPGDTDGPDGLSGLSFLSQVAR